MLEIDRYYYIDIHIFDSKKAKVQYDLQRCATFQLSLLFTLLR